LTDSTPSNKNSPDKTCVFIVGDGTESRMPIGKQNIDYRILMVKYFSNHS